MDYNWIVLFDLDNTLVKTGALVELRRQREWREVYSRLGETSIPEGTREFVSMLYQQFKIGVVTNSPRRYSEKVLEYHRLELPVLVAYHDVRFRKPHAEPILRATALLAAESTRCIYVGDESTDQTAAINAGANYVPVSWDGQPGACGTWNEVWDRIKAILAKGDGRS